MAITTQLDPWVMCPRPNPWAKIRMFCFPYAGGGPSLFRKWPDHLPATVEICPIQLPGRGSRLREPAFTDLPALIQALTKALWLRLMDKPFVLFGHSMGALVSFELTRQLRRQQGPRPLHLFISARRAPHLPDSGSPIHRLPEPEFLERLRRLNGTPAEILQNAELMRLMIPTLRADFAVCETYRYLTEPVLDCSISALGGQQDRDVTRAQLDAWRHQTSASFSLRMFPGDHFYICTGPSLLLRALSEKLHRLADKFVRRPLL